MRRNSPCLTEPFTRNPPGLDVSRGEFAGAGGSDKLAGRKRRRLSSKRLGGASAGFCGGTPGGCRAGFRNTLRRGRVGHVVKRAKRRNRFERRRRDDGEARSE